GCDQLHDQIALGNPSIDAGGGFGFRAADGLVLVSPGAVQGCFAIDQGGQDLIEVRLQPPRRNRLKIDLIDDNAQLLLSNQVLEARSDLVAKSRDILEGIIHDQVGGCIEQSIIESILHQVGSAQKIKLETQSRLADAIKQGAAHMNDVSIGGQKITIS